MLDFHRGWLPQILGFAAIIADGELEAAWLHGPSRRSRVASFDELYQQVFEDLEAEAVLPELRTHLPGQVERQEAIATFLRAIAHLHLQVEADPALRTPRRLVATNAWTHLRGAAAWLRLAFELPRR